jgi:hypothetical protein
MPSKCTNLLDQTIVFSIILAEAVHHKVSCTTTHVNHNIRIADISSTGQ